MNGTGETCTEKRNHSTSIEDHGVVQKQLRIRLELFVASVLPLVHLLQRATGSRVIHMGSEHGCTAPTFQDDATTTPMFHSMEGTRVGTRTSRPAAGIVGSGGHPPRSAASWALPDAPAPHSAGRRPAVTKESPGQGAGET